MQKWYPEPFSNEGSIKTAQAPKAPFQGLEHTQKEESSNLSLQAQFRSESGFLDSKHLMAHLTREERATVFELVEHDVIEQYQRENEALAKNYEKALQEFELNHQKALETWASQVNRAMKLELKKASGASARLAILLAEKIVRCQVAVDPDVLVRALETSIFKIQDSTALSVTVNPEEAESLRGNTDFLKQLNIQTVESDRRIQAGGCIVNSPEGEWDASVESQLGSLAELVEEMIGTTAGIELPGTDPSEGRPTNELD